MKTLAIDENGRDREDGSSPRTWLVRIGSAGAPFERPEMISLDRTPTLRFGRRAPDGDRPSARLSTISTVRIEVDDPWMSSEHAELESTSLGWQLKDLGSSNGTLVWGQRRSSMLLADGDQFETGGTFWLFRSMVTRAALPTWPEDGVCGSLSPPFIELVERMAKVARTRVPMLFLGATGTGKEVLAREVHRLSRRPGPFLAVNTGAIQKTLVASELFGVEKGAHSTAEQSRIGQIRAADGGTFLLDEIGDMPIEVQVSLLRMLQEGEVLPVGGATPVKVDVRVLCATHQDLGVMVQSGAFRADLYGRIKGCVLEVPVLEDRAEDLGLLIGRFLKLYQGEALSFSIAAYRALLQYPWPLNVRELEKALETAVALASRERIDLDHLPREVAQYKVRDPRLKGTVQADESETIDAALEREIVRLMTLNHGNVSKVARSMGRSRMQVHRWLKRLNVDPEQFRS